MNKPNIMTSRSTYTALSKCIIWSTLLSFTAITQVTGVINRGNTPSNFNNPSIRRPNAFNSRLGQPGFGQHRFGGGQSGFSQSGLGQQRFGGAQSGFSQSGLGQHGFGGDRFTVQRVVPNEPGNNARRIRERIINNNRFSNTRNVLFPDQLDVNFSHRQSRVQHTAIPSLSECGSSPAKFGIRNNVKVQTIKPGDFPWLAAVGQLINQQSINGRIIRKKHFKALCGGTLITNRHVLSAAHCFLVTSSIKDPLTHVRLGEHNLYRDEYGERDYRIVDKRFNNYNSITHSNDIVLLKLDRDVGFNGRIAPACLPFQLPEEEYHKKRLTVVGWGMTTESKLKAMPPKIMVPMREEPEHVPLGECRQSYGVLHPIINKNICAGRGKADACMGDSGGPLNFRSTRGRNAGRVFVVGIVSFGPNICGSFTKPGVYTNVASYEHWIRNNLD